MVNFNYLISLYLFLMSCILFCLFYKHLLLLVISLEFIVIMVVFNLYLVMLMIEAGMYIIMLLLIFFVCEGAMSLTLIVFMVRFNGNDYINSLSFLKW